MRIFLLALAGALFAATAQAASIHSMATSGRTSQPIGHYWLCQQLPQECRQRSWRTGAPELTRSRWKELVNVNAYANIAISPLTDQELHGVEERWSYPVSYGDCEDYVLIKRKMLIERGWPASSLLITVVLRENGEGHAVLTVRTDKGDFILDNLQSKILRWHKTPYQYLKRQSKHHTGHWTTILDNRRMIARR